MIQSGLPKLRLDEWIDKALADQPPMLAMGARVILSTLSADDRAELEDNIDEAMDALRRGDRSAFDAVVARIPMLDVAANTLGINFADQIDIWFACADDNDTRR